MSNYSIRVNEKHQKSIQNRHKKRLSTFQRKETFHSECSGKKFAFVASRDVQSNNSNASQRANRIENQM